MDFFSCISFLGHLFLRAVPDEKNLGVFEGKALYFCGVGGGWLFFNPVGWSSLVKM